MDTVTTNSKHPKGLWVLFGTEMWERFNFYGMRALLTLFMVNSLLIKEADAAIIYGGFLVGAVYAGNNGAEKVSALWLIAGYGVVTIGELCLSPMGLSFVSKLSPARLTALMMGGFFLANSVGNKLSGILASTWYNYENKANYFLVNFGLLIFATLLGLMMLKRLNKIMKESGH